MGSRIWSEENKPKKKVPKQMFIMTIIFLSSKYKFQSKKISKRNTFVEMFYDYILFIMDLAKLNDTYA